MQHLGLEKEIPFRTTSLGKSFGAGGGLIIFRDDVAEGKWMVPWLSTLPIFSLAPQVWNRIEQSNRIEWDRPEDYQKKNRIENFEITEWNIEWTRRE